MADTNKNTKGKKESSEDNIITQAHIQADRDIKKDPDFKPDPAADLDEGELAKLEGEK